MCVPVCMCVRECVSVCVCVCVCVADCGYAVCMPAQLCSQVSAVLLFSPDSVWFVPILPQA